MMNKQTKKKDIDMDPSECGRRGMVTCRMDRSANISVDKSVSRADEDDHH